MKTACFSGCRPWLWNVAYLSSLFSQLEGSLNSFSSTEAQVCPGLQLDGCITSVYWFFDSPFKTVVYSLAFYDKYDKPEDLSHTLFETFKKSLELLGLKNHTVELKSKRELVLGIMAGIRHWSLTFFCDFLDQVQRISISWDIPAWLWLEQQ